jgi:two-component system, NarL family, response regulator DevR
VTVGAAIAKRHDRVMAHDQSDIAVLLVDDHDLYRDALRDALDNEDGIQVCASASSVSEALAMVGSMPVGVAILDRRLQDGDGIDLCRKLVDDFGIACILLTASESAGELLDAARAAGAYLVIQKGENVQVLAASIRAAASTTR